MTITPTADQTAAAPIDALLIARAFLRDDDAATQVLLKHSDPYSTTLQLAGWLKAAIERALATDPDNEHGDRTVDDVLDRWLTQVRSETEQ
ncbi:MAG: hypothetical protein NTW76_02075 [Corynebacteriales bacterium]|nr:hypothetical protein [Mycobacteriales bacterium]